MAQPPLYSRQYSFSAYQARNPSSPLPAQQVDIELNAVRASLNAAIGSLGLIQRDDGHLANNSVAMESIQPAVRLLLGAGWTPRGAWAPNTAYVVGNVVSEAGSTYVCNTAHVSLTTFAASSALWTTLFAVAPPPSTSYPEPLVGNTGQFLVATAAGASAWQTLTVPLASSTTTGVLPLAKGGTGAADATAARAALSAASQAAVTTAQATADSALNVANNRVAKAGDSLTGFLTLHADPTSALHAATKQYVDASYDRVIIQERLADGTHAGSAVAGSWQQRGVNLTEVLDSRNVASVAGATFTLAAGSYDVTMRCPFFFVGGVRTRLFNVTDSAAVPGSLSETVNAVATTTFVGHVFVQTHFRLTIAASKTFRVEYWCQIARTVEGLGGHDSIAAGEEVYATIDLRPVA